MEFIDIYPSLCELAGLPLPKHLEGRSLVPLLKDPRADWKTQAIGRYRRGDTIRTDRYRFSLYTNNSGAPLGRVLYDHEADPGEMVNISETPALRDTVHDLTTRLRRDMGKPSPEDQHLHFAQKGNVAAFSLIADVDRCK